MGRRRHSDDEKRHHQLYCPACGHRARAHQLKAPVRGCPNSTCNRFKVVLMRYTHEDKQAWVWPHRPRAPNGTGRIWT